jgi:hypothetical protein
MPLRKSRLLVTLILAACGVFVAGVGWIAWGFGVGHEARFRAETVCAPRNGAFKRITISVEGVVPRLEDVALNFPADVRFVGNDGQELAVRVNATPTLVLPDGAPGAGLDPGSAFDERAVLRCLEAVGLRAADDSTELPREFLSILVAAGAGPKSEPRSGKYLDVVSHSSKYL